MSMNFREYIGTVKGQSPGADAVRGYYTQLKSTFASRLSQTDKTEQDFKELENFLNDIFFPKDNGDKKQSNFYQVLAHFPKNFLLFCGVLVFLQLFSHLLQQIRPKQANSKILNNLLKLFLEVRYYLLKQ